MSAVTLSAIHVYPVKSLAGFAPLSAEVQPRGLAGDRRWMIVDAAGRFLTQRTLPRMALVTAALFSNSLQLNAPTLLPLLVPLEPPDADALTVQVWRSVCKALPVSAEADAWLSDALGQPCRLVYMPDSTRRAVSPGPGGQEGIVSFADGYPLLLTGAASLGDLNARLDVPVPMDRFRPNLVVSGTEAFAEDGWKRTRIGAATFHVVKPCDRCVVTTLDQATGVAAGPEPLRTLAGYRLRDQKVLFGQNLIPETLAVVRVGDSVEVLE